MKNKVPTDNDLNAVTLFRKFEQELTDLGVDYRLELDLYDPETYDVTLLACNKEIRKTESRTVDYLGNNVVRVTDRWFDMVGGGHPNNARICHSVTKHRVVECENLEAAGDYFKTVANQIKGKE